MKYEKLLNHDFPVVREHYTEKDTMLYALGIGIGEDPCDEAGLQYVYEENLQVVPSQAVILAHPGFWAKDRDIGLDWVRVLHAGQEIIWHKPLPPAATVESKTRITEVIDKGAKIGAVINSERTVTDVDSGEELCTLITTILARGDGGHGAERRSTPKQDIIPKEDPHYVCDLTTSKNQALLYRLSGDYNPIHASPRDARDAGFEAPILHGLCTLGVATHALLKTCCDYNSADFKRMRVRFSSPVYPGETIRTEIWRQDNILRFRCKSLQQGKIVINNGYLELASPRQP